MEGLASLRNPAQTDFSEPCSDSQILVLLSLLFSFTTDKCTHLKTQLSMTLHGVTRSHDIVEVLGKLYLDKNYQNVINLYALWAKHDVETSICLEELALEYQATGTLDNDDFQSDTHIGVNTSCKTNVMFVQPEIVANNHLNNNKRRQSKSKPSDLKDVSVTQHSVEPYKTLK